VFVVWSGDGQYVACSHPSSTTITAYSSIHGAVVGKTDVSPADSMSDLVLYGMAPLFYQGQYYIQSLDCVGNVALVAWDQGAGLKVMEDKEVDSLFLVKQCPLGSGSIYVTCIGNGDTTSSTTRSTWGHGGAQIHWVPSGSEPHQAVRIDAPFVSVKAFQRLVQSHHPVPTAEPLNPSAIRASHGEALDVIVDAFTPFVAIVFPYAIYIHPLVPPNSQSQHPLWQILEGFGGWVITASFITPGSLWVLTAECQVHVFHYHGHGEGEWFKACTDRIPANTDGITKFYIVPVRKGGGGDEEEGLIDQADHGKAMIPPPLEARRAVIVGEQPRQRVFWTVQEDSVDNGEKGKENSLSWRSTRCMNRVDSGSEGWTGDFA